MKCVNVQGGVKIVPKAWLVEFYCEYGRGIVRKSEEQKRWWGSLLQRCIEYSRESPSRMRRVLLISLGITIHPRASTRRTILVAFIYLSPFTIHLAGVRLPPLHLEMLVRACRGDYRPRIWKPISFNHFTNYAVSICKRPEIIPR